MIIEFNITYRCKVVYYNFYELKNYVHGLNPNNHSIINSFAPHFAQGSLFWNSVADFLREKIRSNKKEKIGKSRLRY